ncbi:aminotransferase class III-fold pyridoxal phosphate-dependent enzyme [Kiloniella sp. EL199]|uniref:aminotransferase class III-fold pyridoxal phosphate-dependent enzyme n=1 Tax=Kiloniella sp. EL199 TaxID=2107581 RepID=UPI000EA30CDB|nr:aminotransferase class III-fold pyridoxal phosphate-dependent enzyme [Kiloniella sp. EL199]
MKTVAIIQARMGSSRLPGKVLREITNGQSVLAYMVARMKKAQKLGQICVATSEEVADQAIVEACKALEIPVFCGSETDVLDRFYKAAKTLEATTLVRLTADCPAIDPDLIDQAVSNFETGAYDYYSNALLRTYPDGLDVEVFSFKALEEAHEKVTSQRFREHVTPYLRTGFFPREMTGDFRVGHLKHKSDFSHLRWTLDTEEDLCFLQRFLPLLPEDFSWEDGLSCLMTNPDLLHYNRDIKSRTSALADLETGQDVERSNRSNLPRRYEQSNSLFERVEKIIPLASQTFSKSYQQVSKGAGPLFLDSGKGARVFDIDGNSYIDYVMGLLPNVLGYGDPDIDAAIHRQLEKGITFSLPSDLEFILAEKLVELIPSAEQVRFGKNGSDATSAAIRLARAYTGRDKVVACGYHGWHDWYIGTTTRNLGVPASVQELSLRLDFGDFEKARDLFTSEGDQIAAIILEPCGAVQPPEGYLQHLRDLCDHSGTVLIFDEIITGFRIDVRGAQHVYNVTPDLSCFGKAMANGMPISAVVGQKRVMRLMEDIFFSGTFGGETLSLAAACATIDKLTKYDVPSQISACGKLLKEKLNALFRQYGFQDNLSVYAEDWWPLLKAQGLETEDVLFKTLLRQELNANGILLNASFNLSWAHTAPEVTDETISRFEKALQTLKAAVDSKKPDTFLRGELIQPTFQVRKSS